MSIFGGWSDFFSRRVARLNFYSRANGVGYIALSGAMKCEICLVTRQQNGGGGWKTRSLCAWAKKKRIKTDEK